MTPGLPADLPIVDHHAHLSANGEGIAAVRRFAAAGGTHLFLATQNYSAGVPLRLEEYAAQFDETERLAEQAAREAGVTVYSVLAPYPVDLVRQSEHLGAREAVDLQNAALDLAGRRVREHRAVALGEVGRCHFPVDAAVRAAGVEVFRHALEVARDVGCPAVVHSEDLDASGFAELAGFAATVGCPAGRLIKHYARSVVPAARRAGVAPSFLARREIVLEARGEPGPWFLETDFLDDPRRPGAVLDLTTVPRRARQLVDSSPDAAERLRTPFVESVRQVYGFTPEVGERAR